jgi:hypothetical protein
VRRKFGLLVALAAAMLMVVALSPPVIPNADATPASYSAPVKSVPNIPASVLAHAPRPAVPDNRPKAEAAASVGSWAGYGVTADAGKTMDWAGTTLTVPAVDCATTIIGTSGYALETYWVGIDGFSGSTVEQDGIDVWCTGTPGKDGTGNPSYGAWYEICCGQAIVYYSNQPSINANDVLVFSVKYLTSGTHSGDYEFAYIDKSDANKELITYESCAAVNGSNDCLNATAEVLTEATVGATPTTYTTPQWEVPNGPDYRSTFVQMSDGSKGTLNALAGEYGTEKLTQSFPGYAYPYNIVDGPPQSVADYGDPGALSADGTSFDTTCSNFTSATAETPCH